MTAENLQSLVHIDLHGCRGVAFSVNQGSTLTLVTAWGHRTEFIGSSPATNVSSRAEPLAETGTIEILPDAPPGVYKLNMYRLDSSVDPVDITVVVHPSSNPIPHPCLYARICRDLSEC